MVGLVFFVFFVISLLTNILGRLLPAIKDSFGLSLALAGFLPFSFFVAYGPMSIPAGHARRALRREARPHGVVCPGLRRVTSLRDVPVLCVWLSLSVFLIGAGMAMLQVAINPSARVAGGRRALRLPLGDGAARLRLCIVPEPQVYSALVRSLEGSGSERGLLLESLARLVPAHLPWLGLYWIFAAVTLVYDPRPGPRHGCPSVELTDDEKPGALATHRELFGNRIVLLFFLGHLLLRRNRAGGRPTGSPSSCGPITASEPEVEGAAAVSGFWGLMTVGCVLRAPSPQAASTLAECSWGPSAAAMLTLVRGSARARLRFRSMPSRSWDSPSPSCGPSSSLLALNSLARHHGSFSGILCTGIIGGAVLPLVVGWLGDRVGLRLGMTIVYLTLAYILSIGLWARPLVRNKTFGA